MCLPQLWSSTLLGALLSLGSLPQAWGESTISPDHAQAWGANVGWTQWHPDAENGVEIGQYVCSGYIYAANVGWISLGDGSPADGIQYGNESADDFGVNVDAQGNLRGWAYGANIGWVRFGEEGNPQVDLQSGRFSGSIYGLNVGWLSLESESFFLQTETISPGEDQDEDGIPDAWERLRVGGLTQLSAGADLDQDGAGDVEEYQADTHPDDGEDYLRIFEVALLEGDPARVALSWPVRPTRNYQLEIRPTLRADDPWQPSELGAFIIESDQTRLTVTNETELSRSYFRVRAFRPLSP